MMNELLSYELQGASTPEAEAVTSAYAKADEAIGKAITAGDTLRTAVFNLKL